MFDRVWAVLSPNCVDFRHPEKPHEVTKSYNSFRSSEESLSALIEPRGMKLEEHSSLKISMNQDWNRTNSFADTDEALENECAPSGLFIK